MFAASFLVIQGPSRSEIAVPHFPLSFLNFRFHGPLDQHELNRKVVKCLRGAAEVKRKVTLLFRSFFKLKKNFEVNKRKRRRKKLDAEFVCVAELKRHASWKNNFRFTA